ncbi:MAG TPA: amino acid adenylation domain-containing protein [Gemmatimonadales bacterium]|nr:amino acid adenylation domain-containing protein [Gemmatimonadales bacterium]
MTVPFPAGFTAFRREEIEDSIGDRFMRQAGRHPDRLAVRFADKSVLYKELADYSDRIAAAILQRSAAGTEPVAVMAGQGITLIAAILGILRSGKFYVPIDPAWPAARIRALLAALGSGLMVVDDANAALAASLGESIRVINGDRIEAGGDVAFPAVDPSAPAYVYFTSGSTGEPKGVVDTHRNVLHNVMRYTNGLGISPDDRMTLLQTSAFSGAVSSMFGALLNGASLFPRDPARSTPGATAEWIAREEITIYHSVPTLFQSFVPGRRFPSVRVIRLEGDRATHRDVELFRSHFGAHCVLVNGLGATETGLVRRFVIGHDTPVADGIVPIGQAVDDMEVLLLDQEGGAVAAGEVGEIVVRSEFLATGYWNRPDLTDKAFSGSGNLRVYRTGDLGRFRPDGCLEYLGRRDFRVKIRGQTVEVADVERAILGLPGIREVVVVARDLAGGEPGLVAYFTRTEGAPPASIRILREALGARLPSPMIPARYVELDHLPVNANGKIDRPALPAPSSERPAGASPYVAPANALQDTIAEIWEDLLAMSPVGIRDGFLELGGNSLLAVRMIERLGERLGRRISLEVLATSSTVEELSLALLDSESRDLTAPLVLLQPEGSLPAFYFLHGDYRSDGLYCLPLPQHLDRDRPVYLLPPAGLDGTGIPASIEEMAERHLQQLREVQPRGPYLLGGNCNGGLVAFEMARRLVAAGDRVDMLLVIRSYAGDGSLRLPRRLVRMLGAGLGMNGAREGAAWSETRRLLKRWEQVPRGERNRRILAKVGRQAARLVRRNGNETVAIAKAVLEDRREAMGVAFMRAAEEYVPLPYPGRVTLFWPEHDPASPEAAMADWKQIAGDVDLHVVPGDHLTYSTRHLPEFGARLRDCLRATRGDA